MGDLTDGELVRLTRGGDREAYGTLIARYQGHVYGVAYSIVGRWQDAQDIAQETFIRAYVNLDQLRDPARFAARAKLRVALAPYVTQEITPMVQEVFKEHKLPAHFARRVLDKVPLLGWGKGRECTFLGALEAALAVTDHPYKYSDMMGWSGMAFRARWFSQVAEDGGRRWCPSSAVGEMDEEIRAVSEATGWPLRVAFMQGNNEARVEQLTGEIVASITAGRPVLAYEPQLNMDVVYGFESGGKTLLLRDYFQGEKPLRLPPSKLGFLMLFIGDHQAALAGRAALIEALRMAVRNWRRERFTTGPGEYWYGSAALTRWIADIGEAGQFPQEEKRNLCGIGWWNFTAMQDGRRAAATFLRENACELQADLPRPRTRLRGWSIGAARLALLHAADQYAREADFLQSALTGKDSFVNDVEKWSPEMRSREMQVLTQARDLEEAAIAEIGALLDALAQ